MLSRPCSTVEALLTAISGASYFPATQAVSAAALPLPAGAATENKVEAVRALLAGTLAISAVALPLPAGAATEAKLEAVRALLAGTVAISAAALPLPAGAATSAKQDAQKVTLDLTAPAEDLFAIAPNDTTDLATIPKALLCTVAGDIIIRGAGNTSVTVKALQGQIIPIRARRVMATGTTGTVVGLV